MSADAGTGALEVQDTRQPRGLYVLFGAEAWERFSYYGMRALLVLYLVNALNYERENALAVYATYTGLVYLTPMIGGYLADKILGARKAILIGGTVMALGHLAMAFEPLLFPALGLLIVGNGFFKPNISTVVGGLYRENDPRRDGGFTIFYMGINLGAFFSPLVCGTLGQKIGWHWGFGAAGIGMIAGLVMFLAGQRLLGTTGFPPGRELGASPRLNRRDFRDILLYVIGSVLFVFLVLQVWGALGGLTWVVGLGLVAAGEVVRRRSAGEKDVEVAPLTKSDWQRIGVIGILAFFNIFFWMGFEQAGGTMNLFADKQTDLTAGGLISGGIPASWFQSLNPLYIVSLAPLFSLMWLKIDSSRFALSTPVKMAFGMIILGLGFVVMFFGDLQAKGGVLISPMWLVVVYLLHTIGELCLSPIGLSMVSKLAPGRLVSLMMGVWFASSAIANYLAGTLEAILHDHQVNLYGFLVASSIGAGVCVLLLTPFLKKWMQGRG